MKNVFFALAFMLVGTFAFANTEVATKNNIDAEKIEKIQNQDNFDSFVEFQSVEGLSFLNDGQNSTDEHGRCRWRTCTYRNGVRVSCTAWTYGYCLDEVVLTPSPN